MRTLLCLAALFWPVLGQGKMYIGDLGKGECSLTKGKDFKPFLRAALSNKEYEVTYDREGTCGESLYLIKRKNRKHWAVFPTLKNCQCFMKTAQTLLDGKGPLPPAKK